MASNTGIIEEAASALRGVGALLVGDRRAPGYFDFSQRGLAGSFIAFLAITGLNAVLPTLVGANGPAGSIFRPVAIIAILFAFQLGFAALLLRQIKRMDGFVPYIVAENWSSFFVTLGAGAVALTGLTGDFMLFAIVILVIVLKVNIARLVVTLPPLQVAMFLVAQLVGGVIGLMFVGALFPLSPAELQQLGM